MVSSTFTDLVAHRQAVIEAIKRQGLIDIAMENVGASADADVIRSSLEMVRDGAGYIGVISHNYGQTPVSPDAASADRRLTCDVGGTGS